MLSEYHKRYSCVFDREGIVKAIVKLVHKTSKIEVAWKSKWNRTLCDKNEKYKSRTWYSAKENNKAALVSNNDLRKRWQCAGQVIS